jgi:hypothetical protein
MSTLQIPETCSCGCGNPADATSRIGTSARRYYDLPVVPVRSAA